MTDLRSAGSAGSFSCLCSACEPSSAMSRRQFLCTGTAGAIAAASAAGAEARGLGTSSCRRQSRGWKRAGGAHPVRRRREGAGAGHKLRSRSACCASSTPRRATPRLTISGQRFAALNEFGRRRSGRTGAAA